MSSVQVSSNSSRFGQAVEIRDFHLTADEPSAVGGNDAGPTPVELVRNSLSTQNCFQQQSQIYARPPPRAIVLSVVAADDQSCRS